MVGLGDSLLLAEATAIEQQNLIKTVLSHDLPTVTHMIQAGSIVWPKLISNASNKISSPSEPPPSELGLALLEKVREYETTTPRDLHNSLQAVSTFENLSQELQNSGGYINFCLIDAVNRVAVERLAELLVSQPQLADQLKGAWITLESIHFSSKKFLKMIHGETAQTLTPEVDMTSLDETTIRERILSAVGSNDEIVMQQFMQGKAGTSDLINNLNIPVLLHRICQTDIFANVALAGLIEFYKRGGNASDIRSDNIGPFRSVMQGSEKQFKSDLMNIKQVRTTMLLQFIKEAHDQNNSFVSIALK